MFEGRLSDPASTALMKAASEAWAMRPVEAVAVSFAWNQRAYVARLTNQRLFVDDDAGTALVSRSL